MGEEDDLDDELLRAIAEAPDRKPAEPPMQSGQRVGGFRIIAKLGAGGMGVVYRAEDERLRREVALKVIAPASEPDESARRRFLREARSAAAVNHPNVATIFEVGEHEGRIFIAMELVKGVSLRSMLADRKHLGLDEALPIARQIADGVAQAHEKGIVHRDLKPDNIMVGERVKVLDFGLARIDSDTSPEVASTATNQVAGTPGYMSPEQTTGTTVDARTDVFAFGVLLYEMLAGERPFRGDTAMAVAIAIARDPHVPLSERCADVPDDVERIVDRCLQKSPGARYANAKEILAELDACTTTPMPASARRPQAPAARSRLSPLIGVVAFGALGIAAWRWSAQTPVTPAPRSIASVDDAVPVPSSSTTVSASASASASLSVLASSVATAPPKQPAMKASVALTTSRVREPVASADPPPSSQPPKRKPLDDQY